MPKEKTPLLFLSHRIPYPPNKGDKIRSWHLLNHLSKQHDIYLGTFIDDPEDWQYINHLKTVCTDSCFIEIRPLIQRLKSLTGFLTGNPLSVPYYSSKRLQSWVNAVIAEHGIKKVIVFSSAVIQFIDSQSLELEKLIIDFVDVDSDKWQQYADSKQWPMKSIFKREANKLLTFDRDAAKRSSASLFVSESEAALFRSLAPESADKISHYCNGVDTSFFSPNHKLTNPFKPSDKTLVFTGAMDYWPNIDAVCWFSKEILPSIREKEKNTVFYIVGGKPSNLVMELSKLPGVVVTGRVDDVRPYLQHSLAAVAPMRIARGVQNKVLEAMAMAKPVICTPQAIEGIATSDVLVAENPEQYSKHILDVLSNQYPIMGTSARKFVQNAFTWESTLPTVSNLLKNTTLQKVVSVG